MAPLMRWLLSGLVLVALIWGGQHAIGIVTSWLDLTLMPHTEDMLHRAIVAGTAVYVALMALPFVPGAEIGLTLMTALGGALAPLIYLATAVSLTIAYTLGRMLPPEVLARGLRRLGLRRAGAFVEEVAGLSNEALEQHLTALARGRWQERAVRYRYLALALTFNLPGNVVLGGGGGIALMAGLSRMFSPIPYLLTVLIAVLPVPLAFYLGSL